MKNPTNSEWKQATSFAVNTRSPEGFRSHSREAVNTPLPFVGRSLDGHLVFDRPKSHHHLPIALLSRAIAMASIGDVDFAKIVIDFREPVGRSSCVQTTATDTIVFAYRIGRRGLTRFVLNREPEECSRVVLLFKAKRDHPSGYLLLTGFIGNDSEPEPWDPMSTPSSRAFWAKHALVWGTEKTVLNAVL